MVNEIWYPDNVLQYAYFDVNKLRNTTIWSQSHEVIATVAHHFFV